MDEFRMAFEIALISLNRRTPFAYLAVLGAVLAVVGAAIVALAGEALDLEGDFNGDSSWGWGGSWRTPEPGDALFPLWVTTSKFFANGYYVFLAGVILFAIGIYPFVPAAP